MIELSKQVSTTPDRGWALDWELSDKDEHNKGT